MFLNMKYVVQLRNTDRAGEQQAECNIPTVGTVT